MNFRCDCKNRSQFLFILTKFQNNFLIVLTVVVTMSNFERPHVPAVQVTCLRYCGRIADATWERPGLLVGPGAQDHAYFHDQSAERFRLRLYDWPIDFVIVISFTFSPQFEYCLPACPPIKYCGRNQSFFFSIFQLFLFLFRNSNCFRHNEKT